MAWKVSSPIFGVRDHRADQRDHADKLAPVAAKDDIDRAHGLRALRAAQAGTGRGAKPVFTLLSKGWLARVMLSSLSTRPSPSPELPIAKETRDIEAQLLRHTSTAFLMRCFCRHHSTSTTRHRQLRARSSRAGHPGLTNLPPNRGDSKRSLGLLAIGGVLCFCH